MSRGDVETVPALQTAELKSKRAPHGARAVNAIP